MEPVNITHSVNTLAMYIVNYIIDPVDIFTGTERQAKVHIRMHIYQFLIVYNCGHVRVVCRV